MGADSSAGDMLQKNEDSPVEGRVMPESVRAATDIWQTLREKKGPELLKGLVDELAALHRLCGELGGLIRQLQIQQNFSQHLFAFGDAADSVPLLPTRLDIHAAQLLEQQQGFYELEYDDEGVPFRWTGPRRHFSFRVNVDRRRPLAIELDIKWLVDEARQRDLSLLFDGNLLPFHLRRGGAGYHGRALLPPADRQATTTLTFVVPITLQPSAADTCKLGIAFRKLTIRPAGSEDETLEVGQETAASAAFSCTAADIRDGHPGFYDLEYDQGGIPFRWTGRHSSPAFAFAFSIDRRIPIELEFRAISIINPRRQLPLAVEVDEVEYPLAVERVGDHLEGRLVIPPRAAVGPTSLTFTVPVLLRRRGSDRRELGIAFSELHLRPTDEAASPWVAGLGGNGAGEAEYVVEGPIPAAASLLGPEQVSESGSNGSAGAATNARSLSRAQARTRRLGRRRGAR
jgi:hypothetical protein